MDASTIFMKKSMSSYKETNYGMPSLDLFQLTSELNRPYPQTKFESLNNLCSGVNNNPIGIIRENKPFYVPSNQGYNLCSIEDYENIKQIIKNIPIYRDVYTERTITVPKPVNIAVGLYELISTPDFRDWNYFYENNPKIAWNYTWFDRKRENKILLNFKFTNIILN